MKSSLAMSSRFHASTKRSDVRSVHSLGVVSFASAASTILAPCSSVPVMNQTSSPRRRCQHASTSALTVVYAVPTCGASFTNRSASSGSTGAPPVATGAFRRRPTCPLPRLPLRRFPARAGRPRRRGVGERPVTPNQLGHLARACRGIVPERCPHRVLDIVLAGRRRRRSPADDQHDLTLDLPGHGEFPPPGRATPRQTSSCSLVGFARRSHGPGHVRVAANSASVAWERGSGPPGRRWCGASAIGGAEAPAALG